MKARIRVLSLAALALGAAALAWPAITARADAVTTTIPVGSSPRVVAITPNGARVFVGDRLSNNVSVISSDTDSVIATVPALHPGAMHIGGDGRVYVPDHDVTGSTLTVIDSASDQVIKTLSTGGLYPNAMDTTRDGSRGVVTNRDSSTAAIIDLSNLSLVTTLPVGIKPHSVVVSADGAKAYVANEGSNTISVINLGTNTVAPTPITVGTAPASLRLVGNSLFVANAGSDTVSIIDTASDTVVKTVSVGGAPHGLVDTIDKVLVANEASGTVTAMTTDGTILKADIPVGSRPQRIHVTSDQLRAYVPNEGSDSVSVIDMQTLDVIQTLTVGSSPASLEVLGSSKVYTSDELSDSVSVIAVVYAAPTVPPPASTPPQPSDTSVPAAATSSPVAALSTSAPGQSAAGDTGPDSSAAATAPDEAPAGDAAAGGSPAMDGAASQSPSGTPSVTTSPTAAGATPARTSTATGFTRPAAAGTSLAGGISFQGSTPNPTGDGGGAPSWIWLAVGLGALGAVGTGGYVARARIRGRFSRFMR